MAPVPTIKIFEQDAFRAETAATVASLSGETVCLDETVFYAESGGQPGDTGVLLLEDGTELQVRETRYLPGRLRIGHVLSRPPEQDLTGLRVTARIDWDRRHRLMRMHTCLHLLCSLVDAPVTGCAIYPDYGRLDFDVEVAPDKQALTERLNGLVAGGLPVRAQILSAAELRDKGTLARTIQAPPPDAGGNVRVVCIGDVDSQPCGGTHVRTTDEIGLVAVVGIEKKGRRNRRVRVAFV